MRARVGHRGIQRLRSFCVATLAEDRFATLGVRLHFQTTRLKLRTGSSETHLIFDLTAPPRRYCADSGTRGIVHARPRFTPNQLYEGREKFRPREKMVTCMFGGLLWTVRLQRNADGVNLSADQRN